MSQQLLETLASLYETDETAWLDRTAELLRAGRLEEIDSHSLSEYLTDMSRRDRREVFSRLVTLLTHLLKWTHQPDQRSSSWAGTIVEQRRELRQLLESGTLRNHAATAFRDAYADSRLQAAAETGLPPAAFPNECAWDLETIFTESSGDAFEASADEH